MDKLELVEYIFQRKKKDSKCSPLLHLTVHTLTFDTLTHYVQQCRTRIHSTGTHTHTRP